MSEKNAKHISDVLGQWGSWQRQITCFSLSISLFSALNNLSVSFYAPNINYWCDDNNTHTNQNEPIDDCKKGCQNWKFDNSVFTSTIIDEWGLVCQWNRLASLSQSLYMVGYVLGAVVFGYFSDRYGRLPMIWISIIIEILAGISSALSVNITHFIISRIVLAFSSNGRLLSTFMLVHECVGPEYRAAIGMYIQCGWAVGYCILPAIAYTLPHFRYLIMATSIPEALWLIWLWRIPESPRWLITHNHIDKAENEIRKAVEKNGLSIDCLQNKLECLRRNYEQEENKLEIERKSTIIDLFKTPNLRRSTIILYFTWFVNSFVYYGISLNIGDFGANLFISFFIAGIIEFPSYLFPVLAFRYIGRRTLTAALMYGSGLACFATIPFISLSKIWLTITVAMIGKFFITSSYGIIYVYAAEIYPTVVRQTGVGSCSVAARIGSIIAPFVKDLNAFTGMGVVLSIFGSLSIANGFTIHLLPETRGKQIPDTLEEAELFNENVNTISDETVFSLD